MERKGARRSEDREHMWISRNQKTLNNTIFRTTVWGLNAPCEVSEVPLKTPYPTVCFHHLKASCMNVIPSCSCERRSALNICPNTFYTFNGEKSVNFHT